MQLAWVGNVVIATLLSGCGSSSSSSLFSGRRDKSTTDASVEAGEGRDAAASRAGSGGATKEGTRGSDAGRAPGAGGTNGDDHGMPTSMGGASRNGGGDGGTGAVEPDGGSGVPPKEKDAGAPDADAGPRPHGTPHSVACGAAACDVATSHFPVQACCVGPIQQISLCLPLTPQGCGRVGSLLTCDDAADCGAGQSCCLDVTGNGFAGFCGAVCPLQQLCRDNAECRNGLSCKPMDLRPEYSSCR